jgi:hypothetical protein
LRKRTCAGCREHREGSRKGPQSQLDSRHFDLPDLVNVSIFLMSERFAAPQTHSIP